MRHLDPFVYWSTFDDQVIIAMDCYAVKIPKLFKLTALWENFVNEKLHLYPKIVVKSYYICLENVRKKKSPLICDLTACIRNPENESVSDLPFKDDILY